ncbi:hypothetical protein [Streptomyces sp. NPDC002738]
MDFAHSSRAREYVERVGAFLELEILPREREYRAALHAREDRWAAVPPVIRRTAGKLDAQDRQEATTP